MSERGHDLKNISVIFLGTTIVQGIVDAVGYMALGRVFTANMTGNIVFLGLATEGVQGLSFSRSLLALKFFGLGAVIGAGMTTWWDESRWAFRALSIQSFLLSVAAVISLGFAPPYRSHQSDWEHNSLSDRRCPSVRRLRETPWYQVLLSTGG